MARLSERAEALAAAAGLTDRRRRHRLSRSAARVGPGEPELLSGFLGHLYPACHDDLTVEVQMAMEFVTKNFSLQTAGAAEIFRIVSTRRWRTLRPDRLRLRGDQPRRGVQRRGPMATTVGGVDLVATYGLNRALSNNGALTFPANLAGNPAVSIPSGDVDGLPIGLQVIGRHHEDQLLLDLARVAEREFPWPLTVPRRGERGSAGEAVRRVVARQPVPRRRSCSTSTRSTPTSSSWPDGARDAGLDLRPHAKSPQVGVRRTPPARGGGRRAVVREARGGRGPGVGGRRRRL